MWFSGIVSRDSNMRIEMYNGHEYEDDNQNELHKLFTRLCFV